VEYDTIGDGTEMGFADPGVPAGGVVVNVSLRVRSRRAGSSGNPTASFYIANVDGIFEEFIHQIITWNAFTTTTVISKNSETQDTDVDSMLFNVAILNSKTLRIAEAYLDVTYVVKPVVDVLTPTGTITTDNSPDITYGTSRDPDGGVGTKVHAKIFSSAQYGAGGFDPETSTATFNSGESTDMSGTVPSNVALPDGTYRAYVKVAQTVAGDDLWSDWAYEQFIVSVNKPGVPTLTATADDDNARITLHVVTVAGAATTNYYEVQREVETDVWETIFTLRDDGLIVPSGGAATLYDYDPANGELANYRARSIHDYGDSYAYSAWSSEDSDTWGDPNQWWLKSPSHPELNLAVTLRGQPTRTRLGRSQSFTPFGRKMPISIGDKRLGDQGEVIFRLGSQAERQALDDFLDNVSGPVILQGPPGVMWRDRWLVLGDLSEERVVDASWFPYTFDTFPWTEVERPTGVVVTAWP
jgi:hypothetical protein